MFNAFFYYPILNIFNFIYYNLAFKSLGLSVIFLTLLVKIILFPLFYKAAKTQILMAKLQPLISKIQKEYKKDPKKQTELLLSLYKKYNVNPILSFTLLLVQLPILIALYRIFGGGLTSFDNCLFLGFIDLKKPSLFMASLTGFLQYIQGVLSTPPKTSFETGKHSQRIGQMTNIFFSFFVFFILLRLNSAIGLYWVTMIITSIAQQYYIERKLKGIKFELKHET